MKHLLGAVVVTAAMVALPGTAWAADPEPRLVSLTNQNAGDPQTYRPFQKGQSLPVAAGIANVGAAPVRGVVVDLYITGEMELPRDWTNCEYYGDDAVDGAWCEFDTDLQAATSYLLTPLSIAGRADASRIKYPHSLNLTWHPKSYAAENGGIRGLAKNAPSQGGREPVRGAKVALTLQKANLPVPAAEGDNNPRGSVAFYFVLRTPAPTPTPNTSPSVTAGPSDSPGPTETVTTSPPPTPTSASPSVTSTGTPATTEPPAGSGGGESSGGGGLALTGSNTALVAGGGIVLLLAGAVGLLIVRRRRTRFVA